jgi:AraC family transcriptional regulator
MSKVRSQLAYAKRIARVTEHMAAHLDSSLELESLAGIAHFSPWHFHRVYRELTGETVGDAVRRMRLHRAAGELLRSGQDLAPIAKRAGYGSVAAFSRAFSTSYGLPPGEYRQRGQLLAQTPPTEKELSSMYEVTIAPFPGIRLAAIEHRGDYQMVGSAFAKAFGWAAPRGAMEMPPRSVGIYYADALSVPQAELRAHAGVVVKPDTATDGEIEIVDIPPMLCASVLHRGPYAELDRPYRFLYRAWLPEAGRDPADHPCFEEYLNDARVVPPSELLTRIYLPLEDPA